MPLLCESPIANPVDKLNATPSPYPNRLSFTNA
jgi:hypothetical protein